MNTQYRLKISLVVPHYPINTLHRMVDVQGDVNFYELHQAICGMFAYHGEYLWRFFVARQKMDSLVRLDECQERILLPADFCWQKNTKNLLLSLPNITLDSLKLDEKSYLYYWFDLGQNWLHRIRIEKISQVDGADRIKVIKKVGDLPKQHRNQANGLKNTSNWQKEQDFDFEMTLIAAVALIATSGNDEPVRWQELMDNGVADELVKRNLIKPCVNPTHKVRLTPFGESELSRFMEVSGVFKT